MHQEVERPRFIRDNMQIDDIAGTRSKPVYQGVAKDILMHRDIDGTQPRYEKVSRFIRETSSVTSLSLIVNTDLAIDEAKAI